MIGSSLIGLDPSEILLAGMDPSNIKYILASTSSYMMYFRVRLFGKLVRKINSGGMALLGYNSGFFLLLIWLLRSGNILTLPSL